MATMVKSFIDLEIVKERTKMHKETKNEIQKGKRLEQRTPRAGHDDNKHRPYCNTYPEKSMRLSLL